MDRLRTTTRAAALSIASNSTLIVLKLAVGIAIGSVSVKAEAIHSAVDLLAAIIAFFSLRLASRPADKDHHFGHGKAENVSGTIEGLLIFVAAGLIVFEAIERLATGGGLAVIDLGIVVMGISVLVNLAVSRHLYRTARRTDSLALYADAAHLRTDVWTSLGVFGGLALVRLGGLLGLGNLAILDPVLALAVAAMIAKTAFDITRRSFVDLLDLTLPIHEQRVIEDILREHRGRFLNYHRLRSRKAGPQRHIDLHLVFKSKTSIAQAHQLCDELEGHILEALPQTSVTIHVEPPNAVDRDA